MSTLEVSQADVHRWIRRGALWFWGVFAMLITLYWALSELRSLIMVVLMSVFVALAIDPLVTRLASRGWRRGAATAMILGIFLLVSIGFTAAIGTLVAKQVANLIDRGPDFINDFVSFSNRNFNTRLNGDKLIEALNKPDGPLRKFASNAAGNAVSLSSRVLTIVFQGFTVLLFSFYLVADGPKLRRVVCSSLPPDKQLRVLNAWEIAVAKTGGYIYSRALLALFASLSSAIAFTLLGIPSAIALALWIGLVSQFIPVVGTYIAGGLPIIVALANDPISAVSTLIFIVLYQQFENYVLAPRITSRTMELHPAIAFGSALAGGALIGPLGAILALPLAATVQAFTSVLISKYDLVDSHLLNAPTTTTETTTSSTTPTTATATTTTTTSSAAETDD